MWVRVRGVRFAWRSFPNGLYQKKAKIDLGVSSLGKIGEVGICRDHPVPVLPGAREGRGSLELVEIFQMSMVPGRFTPVCRSRYGAGAAGRGAGAGRFVRAMGPLPLCVVLLVQANRNDTSDRGLGSAAE